MSPLLSLLTVTAGPVFLQDVVAGPAPHAYTLQIEGEAPLEASQVKGRVDGRRVTVDVFGARVRKDKRTFGQGDGAVRAYRHRDRVELEGRLPDGDCEARVNIAAGPSGRVLARVSCPGVSRVVSAPPVVSAPAEVKIAPEQEALRQAVALAAPVPEESPQAMRAAPPSAAQKDPAPSPATGAPAVPTATEAASSSAPAPGGTNATAPRPEVSSTTQTLDAPSLWGSALGALLPVGVLGLIAFFGLKLARKRRGFGRHVHIVETTPLGPKRALIVVRVGNETLLLGASEAGISLIQVRPSEALVGEAVEAEAPRSVEAVASTWTDTLVVPEPLAEPETPGQVKLLSRLFRKRRQDIPEAWPFANVLDASLLEESIEDRELREKLAMGMEARIP